MATRATGGLVLEQVRVLGLVWGPQLQRRMDADPAAVANVCLAFRYESKHIASGNHHQHSSLPPDGCVLLLQIWPACGGVRGENGLDVWKGALSP